MILKGDCIEVMKALKPNSVDAIVTDPPYGLEFMGKEWDSLKGWRTVENMGKRAGTFGGYAKRTTPRFDTQISYGIQMQLWHTQWLTEAYRVLKPGGSMLVMGGTRTFHRLACAIEDSGFILKDTLAFMYGSGFPKCQDITPMIDAKMLGITTKQVKERREVVGDNPYHRKLRKTNTMCGEPHTGNGKITKSLTPEAQHWDGFKVGGIKPAYESIVWATKALTDIDNFSIMVHKVKELLCHILKLSTTKEGKINGEIETPCGTSQHGIEGQAVSSEVMGMLWSEFAKRNMDLNTVLSWKSILEESLKAGNIYITEMASCTITDLRILNSLLTQNTQENVIPQKKTLQDGEELNASLVVDILTGVLAKLNAILTSSTTELAISQGEKQDSHLNLKPNFSPITWAVKPPEGSYVDNVLKWGIGAVNVDECRVGLDGQKKTSGGCKGNKSGRVGYFVTDKDPNIKEDNSKGRFPANIILSHHPECVRVGVKRVRGAGWKDKDKAIGHIWKGKTKFSGKHHTDPNGLETVESWNCHPDCAVRILDEQSGNLKSSYRPIFKKGKTYNYKKPSQLGGGDNNLQYPDSGGASRFFYTAKASRSQRNAGAEDLFWLEGKQITKELYDKLEIENEINKNNDSFVPHKIQKGNIHPTCKPVSLFEHLIKLVTREGQIILDPFLGSGTTAIAAHNAGRKCVGIEKEDEYLGIAKKRIEYWEGQPKQMEMRI